MGRLVTLTLALLALAAAPASAALVTKPDATTLRFESDPGVPNLVRISSDATNVKFDAQGTAGWDPSIRAQAPCTVSGDDVTCPRAGITRIDVVFSDRGDVLMNPTLPAVVTSIPLVIDAGGGDDSITGGSGSDTIRGGPGGDGLIGGTGADDFQGGPGFDSVTYIGSPVRVDIDDQPDDGATGGSEGDNVHTDVEDLNGTNGDDVLIGSAAGNVIRARAGNDTVDGLGGVDIYELDEGDDTVTSRDGIGERILCGSGDDTVTGDDVDELGQCENQSLSGELVRDIDRDTFAKPADCNDADPLINPAATDVPDNGRDENCDGADASVPDRDADGVARPFDCDDGDAKIRPGATEIYGNKVDEDCNGRNDPLRSLRTSVRTRFLPGARTRIARLQTGALQAGTRVQVVCSGRGCPFKRRAVDLERSRKALDVRKQFKLKALGRGARLELRLLRADSVGQVTRWRFGSGVPASTRLCMRPSQSSPGKC